MLATHRRLLPFVLLFAVYCFSLPIPVMDIDAGQYASLSMELLLRGDWLHFYDRGAPYLDKPPLLFWLNSLSYSVFGINSVSYRLPSLLLWCLGVWSVYQFAKRWYNPKTGYSAALIFASSQGAFLMVNDVRCDTLLTAMVAFSFWQVSIILHRIHEKVPFRKRLVPVFFASLGLAAALLSKGPIGAFTPLVALAIYIVLNRQWVVLAQFDWLLLVFFVFLFLFPMFYGLYTQYDLHPELVVYGKKNVSGVWFFSWTQSFGRITGESVWTDNTGYFFFFHTALWTFMPWGVTLYVAVYQRLRDLFFFLKESVSFQSASATTKLTVKPTYEWLSLGGFLLPFLAISFSHYKLPHYIYVTFPMASVLVAVYYRKLLDENLPLFRIWTVFHLFIALLLGISTVILCEWAFPKWWAMLGAVLIFGGTIYAYYRTDDPMRKLRGVTIGGMLGLNFILNVHLYPTLLEYQSSSEAGKYAFENRLSAHLWHDGSADASLGFYAKQLVPVFNIELMAYAKPPFYLYASQKTLETLYQRHHTNFTVLKTFDEYPVTHLNAAFLNVNTRDKTLEKRYLLRIK